MGSLGGITGNQAAQQLRPYPDAKSAAQSRSGAPAANLDPAALEALDEDILISTVLNVGAVAETAAEHQENVPRAPALYVDGYVPVPVQTGGAPTVEAPPVPSGATTFARERHPGFSPGDRPPAAGRSTARWLIIGFLALAASVAILLWISTPTG